MVIKMLKKAQDSLNGNFVPTLKYFGNWGFAGVFAFLLFQAMRGDQATQFTIYEREAERRTTAIEGACAQMTVLVQQEAMNSNLNTRQLEALSDLTKQQVIAQQSLATLIGLHTKAMEPRTTSKPNKPAPMEARPDRG